MGRATADSLQLQPVGQGVGAVNRTGDSWRLCAAPPKNPEKPSASAFACARRWGLAAAALAAAVLVARGVIGLTLLAMDLNAAVLNGHVPPILLAVEPWFLVGGATFALTVRAHHAEASRSEATRP